MSLEIFSITSVIKISNICRDRDARLYFHTLIVAYLNTKAEMYDFTRCLR